MDNVCRTLLNALPNTYITLDRIASEAEGILNRVLSSEGIGQESPVFHPMLFKPFDSALYHVPRSRSLDSSHHEAARAVSIEYARLLFDCREEFVRDATKIEEMVDQPFEKTGTKSEALTSYWNRSILQPSKNVLGQIKAASSPSDLEADVYSALVDDGSFLKSVLRFLPAPLYSKELPNQVLLHDKEISQYVFKKWSVPEKIADVPLGILRICTERLVFLWPLLATQPSQLIEAIQPRSLDLSGLGISGLVQPLCASGWPEGLLFAFSLNSETFDDATKLGKSVLRSLRRISSSWASRISFSRQDVFKDSVIESLQDGATDVSRAVFCNIHKVIPCIYALAVSAGNIRAVKTLCRLPEAKIGEWYQFELNGVGDNRDLVQHLQQAFELRTDGVSFDAAELSFSKFESYSVFPGCTPRSVFSLSFKGEFQLGEIDQIILLSPFGLPKTFKRDGFQRRVEELIRGLSAVFYAEAHRTDRLRLNETVVLFGAIAHSLQNMLGQLDGFAAPREIRHLVCLETISIKAAINCHTRADKRLIEWRSSETDGLSVTELLQSVFSDLSISFEFPEFDGRSLRYEFVAFLIELLRNADKRWEVSSECGLTLCESEGFYDLCFTNNVTAEDAQHILTLLQLPQPLGNTRGTDWLICLYGSLRDKTRWSDPLLWRFCCEQKGEALGCDSGDSSLWKVVAPREIIEGGKEDVISMRILARGLTIER